MGEVDPGEEPSNLDPDLLRWRTWEDELSDDRDARIRGLIHHLTRSDPAGPFGEVPVPVPVPRPLRPRPAGTRRRMVPTPTAILAAACVLVMVAVAMGLAARLDRDGGVEIAQEIEDLAQKAELTQSEPIDDRTVIIRSQEGWPQPDGSVETADVEVRLDESDQAAVTHTGRSVRSADGQQKSQETITFETSSKAVWHLPRQALSALSAVPEDILDGLAVFGSLEPTKQADVLARLASSPIAPAAVRAGAIRAFGHIGAEPAGELSDRLGRVGPAVVVQGDGQEGVVVFSSDARSVLEFRTIPDGARVDDPAAASFWFTLVGTGMTGGPSAF